MHSGRPAAQEEAQTEVLGEALRVVRTDPVMAVENPSTGLALDAQLDSGCYIQLQDNAVV